MSQAEELLDSLDETIPTHQHDVIDSDSYFIIDPITRAVENTSGSKNLLMQYDHASERYTFELPRYVEGHDMSLCTAVKVHYNNIESGTLIENADVNDLDDLHVDPTDANKVICSWLIKRQATQLVGSLNFLVQYLCATSDGTITYEWHSDIYKNIEIREGRNNGPAAVSDYTDILEQWRAKLSGADGTSVFQYAQEGGYTGTEEDFKKKLAKDIPEKLSAFENDSEFITNTVDNLANYYLKSETYTQDEVKALVSAIPKFSIQVVDILPTEDISTTTVYLVKSGEETDNLYIEYIYVNGAWEYLGKQTVDLSSYALKANIPTKLSELTNDSDFQTGEQVRAEIAKMTHFTFEKVDNIDEVTKENVIYLIPNTTTDTDNIYDEYLLVDGEPELIGSTAIDLSGYVLKEDLPETLPNPQALTFTGAVEGSYDGNEPIEINIPDNSFQLDVLGWKTFKTITIEEADVYEVAISADEIDVSFEEFGLIFYLPNAPEKANAVNVKINGNYNAVLDNVLSLNEFGYFNMYYMHGVDACYMAHVIQRHTTYTNSGTCTTHLTGYPVTTVKSMRIMSRNSVVPFVTGMQVTIIYR